MASRADILCVYHLVIEVPSLSDLGAIVKTRDWIHVFELDRVTLRTRHETLTMFRFANSTAFSLRDLRLAKPICTASLSPLNGLPPA